MRRVFWFSHTGDVGGAEICLVEAVRALGERGVASVVAVPFDGRLPDLLSAAGAEVRRVPYDSWMAVGGRQRARLSRSVRTLWRSGRLGRLVRESGADVVVSNTVTVAAGALAARSAGVPHAWFIHEFGREDHGMRFDVGAGLSLRLVRSLSRRVLVNSRSVEEHFARWIPRERLRRVHYAVELPAGVGDAALSVPGSGGGPLRLAMVAQKTPGKRQEDAVRAVALLAGRGVETRLELVGREDEVYAEHLRALVRELGVEERVRILPFTPDPLGHVAAADAALVCSRMEAFGRSTVEAMKLGRPVVGAASGGTAELVRDGWNGLAYPVGDVAALAAAVERLHRDRDLLARLGENASGWARAEFNRERYGAEVAAVLEETVRADG